MTEFFSDPGDSDEKMTKRDIFAAFALMGFCTNEKIDSEDRPSMAWWAADEMMKGTRDE